MENRLQKDMTALNILFQDVYGEEKRLGSMLEQMGFSPEHIAQLKENHVQQLLDEIDFLLRYEMLSKARSAPRNYEVLYDRYELFGSSKLTLEAIGKKYAISRERVRQIEDAILRRLRRGILENIVMMAACRALQMDEETRLQSGIVTTYERLHSLPSPTIKQKDLLPFNITPEMRMLYTVSEQPLTMVELTKRLNALRPLDMKRMKFYCVSNFLRAEGLVEECFTASGRLSLRPTEKGLAAGLVFEVYEGKHGPYKTVLCKPEAQLFVLEHLKPGENQYFVKR